MRRKLTNPKMFRAIDVVGNVLQALASMAACLWLMDLLVRAIAG